MKTFCSRINHAVEIGRRFSLNALLESMASVMSRINHMEFELGSYDEAIRFGLLALPSNVSLHRHSIKMVEQQLAYAFRTCNPGLKVAYRCSEGLLLWLLMVGAISGFLVTDKDWFMPFLQAKLETLRSETWTELR